MVPMASRRFPAQGWRTRPRTAAVFVALVVLVAAPTAVSAVASGHPRSVAIVLTAAAVVYAAWAYFWRPLLVVEEQAITVVNPVRTHVVPWGALRDVDTRFNLTLITEDERIAVLAAPSPGGRTALRAEPDTDPAAQRALRAVDFAQRPGDQLSSSSGGAALIIRGHWRDLREAQSLPASGRVITRLNLAVAGVGGVLALAAAAAWLLS